MRIIVRPDSPVPIYEQIVAQVVFAIAAGDLPPGELIPSVRDLAHQLLVNANTVARAFQELERLGAVETRRGRPGAALAVSGEGGNFGSWSDLRSPSSGGVTGVPSRSSPSSRSQQPARAWRSSPGPASPSEPFRSQA